METGRYWVVMKSGRKFMVEEWGNNYVQWGDIDPATKKLHKIEVKDVEVIDAGNSLIKKCSDSNRGLLYMVCSSRWFRIPGFRSGSWVLQRWREITDYRVC